MIKYLNLLLLFITTPLLAQSPQWEIAEDKIKTSWADQLNPEKPLPEYPRPQMVREAWQNLNGLWDYAIQSKDAGQPGAFEGKILVPFAAESALSGVGKTVGKDNALWYKTVFELSRAMRKNKVVDVVQSYTAMRKISMEPDENGIQRNN